MRTAIFVQNNLVNPLTAPVADYAHRHGIQLEDRSCDDLFNPDDCGIDWDEYDAVIPYGSVQFIRKMLNSRLAQFIHHDEYGLSASTWLDLFEDKLLNGEGQIITINHVADYLRFFGPMHVRPNSVDKAFTGLVYDAASWAEAKKMDDPNLLCWASPVKSILAEWRCWVVGGQVVEISQYRKDSAMYIQRTTNLDIFEAANHLASIYLPSDCTVLDMALTTNGYKLIEFNPIQSSGWYKADIDTVLNALVRHTELTWKNKQ